jgi:hypothetical protein
MCVCADDSSKYVVRIVIQTQKVTHSQGKSLGRISISVRFYLCKYLLNIQNSFASRVGSFRKSVSDGKFAYVSALLTLGRGGKSMDSRQENTIAKQRRSFGFGSCMRSELKHLNVKTYEK